jgi:hypothetical protein
MKDWNQDNELPDSISPIFDCGKCKKKCCKKYKKGKKPCKKCPKMAD